MAKKIIIGAVLSSAFMFVGCGGGRGGSSTPSSSVDPMTLRSGIFIFYHSPEDICLSGELTRDLAEAGGRNIITRVESNNVNCATYGKVEAVVVGGEACVLHDMIDFDPSYSSVATSCVIGLDAPVGVQMEEVTIVDTFADYL